MQKYYGIGCVKGDAFGKVLVKKRTDFDISIITTRQVEEEISSFGRSVDVLKKQLEDLYKKTIGESGEEAAELIESYQMILCDRCLLDAIEKRIRNDKISCATAISIECEQWCSQFDAMEDIYMKERQHDIRAVCQKLIAIIYHVPDRFENIQLHDPTIIVADMLTPIDTAKLDRKYLKGFVTENSSTLSHAVIMARALDIPAVVGIKNITHVVHDGMEMYINGEDGSVAVETNEV